MCIKDSLSTKQSKADFVKKDQLDKKFSWIQVSDDIEQTVSHNATSFEGWFSKYNIAEFENIPVQSDLLNMLINKLASGEHSDADWAAAGEMEYFYVSNVVNSKGASSSHSLKLKAEGTCKESSDLQEHFEHGMEQDEPTKAICDIMKQKPESVLKQDMQETKQNMKKLAKGLQDLCWDSLAVQGRLTESLATKPYLGGMLDKLKEHHKLLNKA